MEPRVLVSVTDKTGIVELVGCLWGRGYHIISTGGTAKTLTAGGIDVTLVEDLTKFPEMLDGRLKTLHPAIFGGILPLRRDPKHMKAIQDRGIAPIDIVIVNFYDFAGDPSLEQIDIGGPALLRAAAKNFRDVLPVVDPTDYELVFKGAMEGKFDPAFRQKLAMKAFEATAKLDRAIADHFAHCISLQVLVEEGRRH